MLPLRMEVLTMKFEQIKSSSNWQLQQQEQQYQLEKRHDFEILSGVAPINQQVYCSLSLQFPVSSR